MCHCPWVKGFPLNEGVKEKYPLKIRYFAASGSSGVKKLQIDTDMLHIIRSIGNLVFFTFVNIDDLKRP